MKPRDPGWNPEGFETFSHLFPQTPPISIDGHLDMSADFRHKWYLGSEAAASNIEDLASETSIVFVRGYLGNYMPGNLVSPVRALRRLGYDSFILHNRAGVDVGTNVALLAKQLHERETRSRILLCGHSKGGMECLSLLSQHESVITRCVGVALSQTPSGPSRVIESVLQKKHRDTRYSTYRHFSESVQSMMLTLLRARSGGLNLTSESWPELVERYAGIEWPFPVLQTASWSIRPTAWLDSFHARLGEISPGRAHDGQFYLDDLIWPGFAHVLLPEVDHAQPAMGGSGFDCSRYWLTVLSVLADMIKQRAQQAHDQ